MEQMMDSDFVSKPPCSAGNRDLPPVDAPVSGQSSLEPTDRMDRGASFVVILLCSLSLWAAIWVLVASLISPLL
jgi:hypothetical protein